MTLSSVGFRRRLIIVTCAVSTLFLSACQQSGSDERCDAIPGDLVFSELMVDPLGADENKEWIEIFNASSRGIVLEGLVLERFSRTANETGSFDDVSKAVHALKTPRILTSGDYFVMGDADAVVDPLDYSYDERDETGRRLGASFGALPKTPSGLILKCGGKEIDRVVWGDEARPLPPSGVAFSLNGQTTPDSVLNDEHSRWCAATESYDDEGNLGTPGSPNLPCGVTTCRDEVGSRETVPPGVDTLIISEIYADPSGADSGKEWLELVSRSTSSMDLNQVVVKVTKTDTGSTSTFSLESDDCLNLDAESRLVLGASNDLALNGGVTVDVVVDGFSLYNGSELLIELLHLDAVIHSAIIPASEEAASWSLVEVAAEDAEWCLSRANGFFEGAGTPGVGNTCGATCYDVASDTWRVTRDAGEGDLLITEVLANPQGTDTGKEFVEIYNRSANEFDLNGIALTSVANEEDATPKTVVVGGQNCISLAADGYAVLASELDSALNGGLTDVVLTEGLTLLNSKPLLLTLSGIETIDQAAVPVAEDGTSWQLRPQQVTAGANEGDADFCLSKARGVFEGLGTPAQPNTCGVTCLEDGVAREVNSPEVGEVIFTEIFANPIGADAGRDWVELFHTGDASLDLNGLRVETSNGSSTKEWTLESEQCLVMSSGDRRVVGGQGLAAEGIVPFVVIGTATDTLFYASDLSMSLMLDGLSLDSVGPLPVSEGTSTQLTNTVQSATGNDDVLSWCVASGVFPDTPQGTPGEVNGTCP